MSGPDNTLTPTTLPSAASDATYAADSAAEAALGEAPVAATENAEQQEIDAAAFRVANGGT